MRASDCETESDFYRGNDYSFNYRLDKLQQESGVRWMPMTEAQQGAAAKARRERDEAQRLRAIEANIKKTGRELKKAKRKQRTLRRVMFVLSAIIVLSIALIVLAAVSLVSPGYWACTVPLVAASALTLWGHLEWMAQADDAREDAEEKYGEALAESVES